MPTTTCSMSCDAVDSAELDDLLIRSVEKLDSIIALRNELQQFMETGMIDLARARYATGGPRSAISSLSFNLGHMEASKLVQVDNASQISSDSDKPTARFRLQQNQPQPNDDQNEQHNNGQLRQRQVRSMASAAGSMERDSLESSVDPAEHRSSLDTQADETHSTSSPPTRQPQTHNHDDSASPISGYSSNRTSDASTNNAPGNNIKTQQKTNDPLRWFGVLIPSSLRSSKQCFDRALEILTEVASQQNELAHMLDRFQELQLKLNKLNPAHHETAIAN